MSRAARNRPLDPASRASEIFAVPDRVGIKQKKLTVKMNDMPEIPDKALRFNEIGDLLDSFEGCSKERGELRVATSEDKKDREKWRKIEKTEEEKLKKTETEYELLIRQLEEEMSPE